MGASSRDPLESKDSNGESFIFCLDSRFFDRISTNFPKTLYNIQNCFLSTKKISSNILPLGVFLLYACSQGTPRGRSTPMEKTPFFTWLIGIVYNLHKTLPECYIR